MSAPQSPEPTPEPTPDPADRPGPVPLATSTAMWGCAIEWLVLHTRPSIEGTTTSMLFVRFVGWYITHAAALGRELEPIAEVWFAALLDELGFPAASRSTARGLAVTRLP